MLPLDILLAGVGTILTASLWTVGGITALLVIVATYRLIFHPLSRVPGPKLAALSNIWLARHVRDGRMLELGKTIHKRYGPAVRVGPNEVWFHSREAFKSIYGRCSAWTRHWHSKSVPLQIEAAAVRAGEANMTSS